MKHFKKIVKIVSLGLLGLFLATCQKEDTQKDIQTAKTEINSTHLKSSNNVPNYLQNLILSINTMVNNGLLSNGEGQSLISKINNAIKSIDKENVNAANGQLGALINEVELLVDNGIINLEQGQTLTNVAEYVVNLNNGNPLITDGLIAYYPFNENTNDISGNNRNGVSNNITYTSDINGRLYTALNFGGNGFVQIPSIGQTNESFTIAFWYKTDQGGVILSTDNIFLLADQQTNWFITSWNISIGTYSPAGNPAYFDNTWHHVVITDNSSDSRIITYFDGVVQHDRPDSGYFLGNNQDIYIGTICPNPTLSYPTVTNFIGSIDEIYIFNRAINTTEVEQLYFHP